MRVSLPALIISGVLGAAIISMAIILLRGRGAWLIAGFNMLPEREKRRYDQAGLCRFMGKILLGVGVLTLPMGFGLGWYPFVYIPAVLGLVIFAAVYANTGNRFKIK
ncbi:MAG: DUF3784 domain-containing protein [Oscillospiraceae bacterium]|jgi:hypothetical protein|nr:DUF3784 domain-containing protein [Oscillospiraceae bacterium]